MSLVASTQSIAPLPAAARQEGRSGLTTTAMATPIKTYRIGGAEFPVIALVTRHRPLFVFT